MDGTFWGISFIQASWRGWSSASRSSTAYWFKFRPPAPFTGLREPPEPIALIRRVSEAYCSIHNALVMIHGSSGWPCLHPRRFCSQQAQYELPSVCHLTWAASALRKTSAILGSASRRKTLRASITGVAEATSNSLLNLPDTRITNPRIAS